MGEKSSYPASGTTRDAEPAPPTDASPRPLATHGVVRTPVPVASEDQMPHGLGRTRASTAWVGLIAAAVVLVLLLIFILQNLGSVRITYFTATGSFPLGAALLLSAVGGVLLAGLVASLRILQLRRRFRRHNRATQAAAAEEAPVED